MGSDTVILSLVNLIIQFIWHLVFFEKKTSMIITCDEGCSTAQQLMYMYYLKIGKINK